MSDIQGVLRGVSGKRISNASKVLWSYYRSRRSRRASLSGSPISMSIEPTTTCNLGCTECPSGLRSFSRPTGNIDFDLYKDTIEQVKDHLIYLTLYFQGEPFIHPDFFRMTELASRYGIYTSTSTNGHFLSEEKAREAVESGLSRLIISIDGTSQDTYEKYRINGKLSKVLEGVRTLERIKKESRSRTPFTELQFIVFKHNEHQIEEMKSLYKQLGSDKLVFKTAQIYDFNAKNDLIPENEQYSRYSKNGNGQYRIKNELLDHCWRMWHSCVITWDGKVVPCCFDKDASYVLGDLNKSTFQEIWKSDAYNQFRSSLLHSRSEIDICTNCTEGTKVWA